MALSPLQQAELHIYKNLARVLNEYHLSYFALGGTLLGAVRHQGFIPWDDDIDIGMPRPDYDRFLQIGQEALGDEFQVISFANEDRDALFLRYICKVRDRTTPVIESATTIPEYTTAWIDVFPLDALPSNPFLRLIHSARLRKQKLDIKLSHFDTAVDTTRRRPWYQKVILAALQASGMGSHKDTYELLCKIEQLATSYSYYEEDWIVNLFGSLGFRETFPKEWFSSAIELPFEDTIIPCPVAYEAVLQKMYGDYLKLPPEDERKPKHSD